LSLYPHARLLLSAAAAGQFPADQGVEVAIAGRSNAGKSTAINALTGRKALARTSKQPGRTRLLNFFELSPGTRLVDLPGYGYAQGARAERDLWGELIDALRPRRSLCGVLLVVDARRGLLPMDEQLLAWAQGRPRAVHVLLSKADQLPRSAARECLQRTQQRLGTGASVQLFSAHAGTGVEEARALLQHWLRAGHADDAR
jgi:GTP-binding protein